MTKWGLIFMVMILAGCIGESDDPSECEENYENYISSPDYEIYDEEISGLGCGELERRRYFSYTQPQSCGYTVSSGANSEPVFESDSQTNMSEQNTVIDGVIEGRKLVYNNKFSFFSQNGNIITRHIKSPLKATILKKTHLIMPKLIIYNDLLIAYGSFEDEVVGIDGISRIIKSSEVIRQVHQIIVYSINGNGSLNYKSNYLFKELYSSSFDLKLRKNKLFIYQHFSSYAVDKHKCGKIKYIDDSKGETLLSKKTFDLDLDHLILESEQIYFGYYKHHLDQKGDYLIKKQFGNRSSIIKNHGSFTSFKTIDGSLTNSFSLKEFGDDLALFLNQGQDNSLSILDNNLNLVNEVRYLAPGERIYSARFTKDRGYLVTFRNIDPLFSFDLTNIRNPVLLGELKVPGVSHYLHPLGEKYLLGIGDPMFDGRSRRNSEISLFDVGDNPRKLDSLILKNVRSLSAFYNHQSITQFREFIILKNYKMIYIIKLSDNVMQEIGRVEIKDSNTELLIKDNQLWVFEETELRTYLLEEGLPELVWAL